MKKYAFLVASAVVCASASVFADNVQGDNVFGILTVDSSKATDTIVAVPWCACSTTDDQPIAISNIVKTANLSTNDMVYVVGSDGKYNAWTLKKNDENDVLYWDNVGTVSAPGIVTSQDASKVTAVRGSAIILHRNSPTNSNGSAKAFYLFGQVGTRSSFATPIAAGSAGAPAYTLIAPPNTSNIDVVPLLEDPQNGDSIITRSDKGVNKEYFYDGGWKSTSRTFPDGVETIVTNGVDSIFLSCGRGAWYISRNESAPTLTWTGVPTKTSE